MVVLGKTREQLLAMPRDAIYTVEEVALVLDCSKSSVERAMYSGEMKSARVAGGRRITKEWLYEYLDRKWDKDGKNEPVNPAHS